MQLAQRHAPPAAAVASQAGVRAPTPPAYCAAPAPACLHKRRLHRAAVNHHQLLALHKVGHRGLQVGAAPPLAAAGAAQRAAREERDVGLVRALPRAALQAQAAQLPGKAHEGGGHKPAQAGLCRREQGWEGAGRGMHGLARREEVRRAREGGAVEPVVFGAGPTRGLDSKHRALHWSSQAGLLRSGHVQARRRAGARRCRRAGEARRAPGGGALTQQRLRQRAVPGKVGRGALPGLQGGGL